MPLASNDSRTLRAFAPALALLAICTVVNYADRGNFSIVAPILKQEAGLSSYRTGLLLSAFFWSYTLMQFLVGWLADRFEASVLLAIGFLVWSLATSVTGLAAGFAGLFTARLMLGVGESVVVPGSSKILAANLPEHHRGFANGVLMGALRIGNALGTLGAGVLIAKFNWRSVFVAMGLLSLLWLPPWLKWMPRGRLHAAQPAAPSVFEIIRQRSFWGGCLGHFSFDYLLYFLITWLPGYLVIGRHLSLGRTTAIATTFYAVDAVAAVATGAVSDFWIRNGRSATLVRKTIMALGYAIAVSAMIGCGLANAHTYFAWLMFAALGSGVAGSAILAFPQALAGPVAAGKWVGLQNGLANLAGVIGPTLTGFAVDRTGSFVTPFVITAVVLLIGGFGWVLITGKLEPVKWAYPTEGLTPVTAADPGGC
jgi:MFS family permease